MQAWLTTVPVRMLPNQPCARLVQTKASCINMLNGMVVN